MKVQLELMTKWYFFIPTIIGAISLLWSVFNFIVGRAVANKIVSNDLKHLTDDVDAIKEGDKEFKKEIKDDIHSIKLGISRIEKKQIKRDAICDERHKLDKK